MALILLIIFLIVAVIGRIIIQYKTTGDHGIRPAKMTSPLIAKMASLLLLLSFLSLFILTLFDALHQLEPDVSLGKYSSYLGAILGLCGIIIVAISQQQMGTSWRVGVDDHEKTPLITHGLYAYIRNPIYTGLLVFSIGLLVLIPGILMLFSIFMLYISIELHVRYIEEPYLYQMHKETFETYIQGTGRYLPKVKHANR